MSLGFWFSSFVRPSFVHGADDHGEKREVGPEKIVLVGSPEPDSID